MIDHTAHPGPGPGFFFGPDLQHINDPGYNRDRGPVWVPGFRFPLDF